VKNDFDVSDLLVESSKNSGSVICLEDSNEKFVSSNFHRKEFFIGSLINAQSSESHFTNSARLSQPLQVPLESRSGGVDSIILKVWKNIENVSARLIEKYDDVVVLECLIDKEIGLYEEREFRLSLFVGYDLRVGNLFYLRFFDRENETRMEIHNDPKLVSQSDFPKKDFTRLFKESKLFKK